MYLDSEFYLKHINDDEQIEVLKKIIDKINIVLKDYTLEYTDFLDPYQRRLAESILNRIDGIDYSYEGGIEEAERKSIIIYPDYLDYDRKDSPIKVLKISGNFKFNRSSHGDYLGSIMGLGIKRDKLGDIFPFENRAYIVISRDISDYIIMNLDKIGKETVKVEQVEFKDIEYSELEFERKIVSISSNRLDNFLSEVFNLSRKKATSLIESKRVKVDFQFIDNKAHRVESNSLLSVRGFGRAKVLECIGESRKGKLRYEIDKYI
ncbi:MAG: YlmH/Sll1252 family protein [Andreesenia angusta]|nr:YlmH/Sll1252 family protein [Andreesenia angusta]